MDGMMSPSLGLILSDARVIVISSLRDSIQANVKAGREKLSVIYGNTAKARRA
jgi:hypothetical protein